MKLELLLGLPMKSSFMATDVHTCGYLLSLKIVSKRLGKLVF